ncbi:hypothetical protein MSG28_015314 [Choristoneura fumiferana]|uniref:Uncharacterized protein n=1 Tax=Choristoneura fumiferana TaxID=7141 RepID=A0ACC0KAD8_CHOFU|nr:hypothetical protein MSG28_015314 [Choristoneura fumiferana]
MILTVGTKHFLVWGHPPPPEAGSQCKTVCYIFDPHMLDDRGTPHKLYGAGAFLRYAGGEYPLCSLSAVSLATSKATPRKKPPPVLPMAPERAPPGPTNEQLMSLRGEDFFLYCPKSDGHTYGR